jgi:hypothetical protein
VNVAHQVARGSGDYVTLDFNRLGLAYPNRRNITFLFDFDSGSPLEPAQQADQTTDQTSASELIFKPRGAAAETKIMPYLGVN